MNRPGQFLTTAALWALYGLVAYLIGFYARGAA